MTCSGTIVVSESPVGEVPTEVEPNILKYVLPIGIGLLAIVKMR